MMSDEQCLVTVLKRCRQSSKEAVENIHEFSDFKKYMHVERPVEVELVELIQKAAESPISQLILVCGSVGDGKSHMISYLKDKHPHLLQMFKLHNDATESFEPQKTSVETLADEFLAFSDDNLSSATPSKAILAINLGTLNNFIYSDFADKFGELKSFVEEMHIFDSQIIDNEFNPNSSFQFINFSDYHLFELTEDGPESSFIQSLLGKLTNPSEDNPFYSTYEHNCKTNCPASLHCPIKLNYELLSQSDIQQHVIETLIKVVIKEKFLISTRGLLNFIYDLLVHPDFSSKTDAQIKESIQSQSFADYIEQLLPMLLFEKPEVSTLSEVAHRLSPTQVRAQLLDDYYLEFRSSIRPSLVFERHVNLQGFDYLQDKLEQITSSDETLIIKLIRLFVNLYFLRPKVANDLFEDKTYLKFMRYLYMWNTSQIPEIRDLLKYIVPEAVYKWNGEGSSSSFYIQVGKPQTTYLTLQRLEIEPAQNQPTGSNEKKPVLTKFLPTMFVSFKPKHLQAACDVSIEIDYSLYNLLSSIKHGYCLNKSEKLRFIKFDEFTQTLGSYGGQGKELQFERRGLQGSKKFTLNYEDMFRTYTFSEV